MTPFNLPDPRLAQEPMYTRARFIVHSHRKLYREPLEEAELEVLIVEIASALASARLQGFTDAAPTQDCPDCCHFDYATKVGVENKQLVRQVKDAFTDGWTQGTKAQRDRERKNIEKAVEPILRFVRLCTSEFLDAANVWWVTHNNLVNDHLRGETCDMCELQKEIETSLRTAPLVQPGSKEMQR